MHQIRDLLVRGWQLFWSVVVSHLIVASVIGFFVLLSFIRNWQSIIGWIGVLVSLFVLYNYYHRIRERFFNPAQKQNGSSEEDKDRDRLVRDRVLECNRVETSLISVLVLLSVASFAFVVASLVFPTPQTNVGALEARKNSLETQGTILDREIVRLSKDPTSDRIEQARKDRQRIGDELTSATQEYANERNSLYNATRGFYILWLGLVILYVVVCWQNGGYVNVTSEPRSKALVLVLDNPWPVLLTTGMHVLLIPRPIVRLIMFDSTEDELTFEIGKQGAEEEETSKDGIPFSVRAQWFLKVVNPYKVFMNVGTREDVIEFFKAPCLSATRNVGASTDIEKLRTNREAFEKKLLAKFGEFVDGSKRSQGDLRQGIADATEERWGVRVTVALVTRLQADPDYQTALKSKRVKEEEMKGVLVAQSKKSEALRQFKEHGATFAQADLAYESEQKRVTRTATDHSIPNLGSVDMEQLGRMVGGFASAMRGEPDTSDTKPNDKNDQKTK